jgi:hypothetical protein
MAVAITGSTYSATTSSSGDGSIGSITIPSDATAAIFGVSGYRTDSKTDLLYRLNWDNHTSNEDFDLIRRSYWATTDTSLAFYIMPSGSSDWPGTGSGKTLYYGFSDDGQYGYSLRVFFVSGSVTTSPIIASDGRTAGGNWTSGNISTGSGDMAIVAAFEYDNQPDPVPSGSGQTSLFQAAVYNSAGFSVGYEIGETTPSIDKAGGSDFLIPMSFSIDAAAAAAGGLYRHPINNYLRNLLTR